MITHKEILAMTRVRWKGNMLQQSRVIARNSEGIEIVWEEIARVSTSANDYETISDAEYKSANQPPYFY